MFIRQIALPRRVFLKGMGAAVALPMLEAMVPALKARTPASPRTRFIAVFIPNGAITDQWIPAATGANIELSPSLAPLASFRDSLLVVSNLTRANPGVVEGDHAISASGWLTGVYPKRTEAEDIRANTSIDQIVARRIGQDTPFPSLELATEDFSGYIGACTSGFSCAYANTISWSSPTTPLPMEINPRSVFERMFGRPGTPAQRAARRERNRSILDLIADDARRLRQDLGMRDQTRLDQYLDNIRELERRIERAEAHHGAEPSVVAPVGVPDDYEAHIALMFDLMTVALQAELTRVGTFMMARELSQRTYPQAGVTEQHHTVSHHGNDAEKIAQVARINRYHAGLFTRFLESLKNTSDGEKSLFDNSLIVYGGGMGNPNQHASDPLPILLAGGALGTARGHLQMRPRTPVGNLWVSVANHFGDPLDRFGDSDGRVEIF